MTLNAFGLNCTLKAGGAPSSTQTLLDQVLSAMAGHGATTDSARVVDHDVRPGVTADEGGDDQWPALRQRIMDAQLFVLATPIWLGHPSSVAQRVLERLDAVLGEIGDDGCYPTFGKVAVVAVVGNEDGAHHVHAQLQQGLIDVGFTIPAGGHPYWVGEAMGGVDYKDLDRVPETVAGNIRTAASNAVHLARLLQQTPYPSPNR
ncbi:NAD(P)H-dependent oxidoreductase [Luteimonas sp. 3794]|uniref:flavodoxin family protein n=1 Tax=Luteimonas sp. 3794 TaxID=2817730 RepID=UPI00285FDCF3|nr:NAD(P)H-dependent oxidoreductase [Luteimonas sp. 3794]MDR6992137.1 multimeric flavodoxin WrbA [Luteimonas sp. 3794]